MHYSFQHSLVGYSQSVWRCCSFVHILIVYFSQRNSMICQVEALIEWMRFKKMWKYECYETEVITLLRLGRFIYLNVRSTMWKRIKMFNLLMETWINWNCPFVYFPIFKNSIFAIHRFKLSFQMNVKINGSN